MQVTKAILLLLAVAKAEESQASGEGQEATGTQEQATTTGTSDSGTESQSQEATGAENEDADGEQNQEESSGTDKSDSQQSQNQDSSTGSEPSGSSGTGDQEGSAVEQTHTTGTESQDQDGTNKDDGPKESDGSETSEGTEIKEPDATGSTGSDGTIESDGTSDGTQNQDSSGTVKETGTQEDSEQKTGTDVKEDTGSSDGTESEVQKSSCSKECGTGEACATLSIIADLLGNQLPENHPNFGVEEYECIDISKCWTNFKNESGNFVKSVCPKEFEPIQENLVAPLSPQVEIPGVSPEQEAEQAAITLAQNKPQAGETGGACNLDGQKCVNVHDCCGTGINELGGREENICGNGKGQNDPIKIGSITYDHTCSAMKMVASFGSIIAAFYMM